MHPLDPRPDFVAANGAGYRIRPAGWMLRSPRQRYWLHFLLFVLTLLTTTAFGALLQANFDANDPPLDIDAYQATLSRIVSQPGLLLLGLPFSLSLLSILLAHEFGHWLACRAYGIDASLPYFIPSPLLGGTFGAFIHIRERVTRRRHLFDIAIAGPIAGFVFLIPVLGVGLAFSKVVPSIVETDTIQFGANLLLKGALALVFPNVPAEHIYLHPVARAAWIGMLATALNLMPAGQLDGGHLLYLAGDRIHRLVSWSTVAGLLALAAWKFNLAWLLWAVMLLLFRRHPAIYDDEPLGSGRIKLAGAAAAIFVVCFLAQPVR